MHLNSSSAIRKWMIGILISSVLIACNSPESQDQIQSNTESHSPQGFSIQPIFELEWVSNEPVLTNGDPGTAQNKYGFEGGRVIKYDNAYHMFTTEMYVNPLWTEALFFDLEEKVDPWWGLTRTPLGLVPESENQFTVFFTAYNKDMYGIPNIWQINDDSVFDGYYASVGMFRVKLKR